MKYIVKNEIINKLKIKIKSHIGRNPKIKTCINALFITKRALSETLKPEWLATISKTYSPFVKFSGGKTFFTKL